jgi:hypothetical protein
MNLLSVDSATLSCATQEKAVLFYNNFNKLKQEKINLGTIENKIEDNPIFYQDDNDFYKHHMNLLIKHKIFRI